jgi:putative hydrolase of the HAD superfamily
LNIVFDLGGVVFNWQPDTIIKSVFAEPATQDLVRKQVFEHSDWIELDRGTLTYERAVARAATRSGLSRQCIADVLDAVPPSLTPIDATIELIRDLGDSGHRLFVLSNMHLASIAYLERQHRIWDLFEGVVISSRIQMVKPEIQIFEHLLTRYEIDASDTVFIDDMAENVTAAASLGFRTVRFVDPAQCAQALERELLS